MTKSATVVRKLNHREALNGLIQRADGGALEPRKSTVAARKAQLRADLENFDIERLLELKDRMTSFVDLVTLSLGEGELMTPGQTFTLMSQFLSQRDIAEFMEVVRDRIKEIAFLHMDAELAAKKAEDPEHTNHSIEVPALGKKFCREATGYADPTVDHAKLRAALGGRADEVYETKLIPAHTTVELNYDKLFALIEREPELMAKLSVDDGTLIPGAPKAGRLVVRDL